MAADLLTTIRAEIDARLRELGPLMAEHEELLSVADALALEDRSVSAASSSAALASASASRRKAATAARTARAGRAAPRTARPKVPRPARKRPARPSIGPAGQAVLAALEHGSHTVAELVMVTALPAPDIRRDLRPLLKLEAIVKTERDGKTAYALPS